MKNPTSENTLPIPAVLEGWFREYLKLWKPNPLGLLFCNRNGRAYTSQKVVEYQLWPLLDALKIRRAGFHAFRHAHTTLLLEGGASPKVAQRQLRHADARVTLKPREGSSAQIREGQDFLGLESECQSPSPTKFITPRKCSQVCAWALAYSETVVGRRTLPSGWPRARVIGPVKDAVGANHLKGGHGDIIHRPKDCDSNQIQINA